MGQDAAFEKGVELVFDELRKVGAGGVFSLGEEGRGGARCEPKRRPAPARAVGQCLASEAAEVVASDDLKPRATPQSPCVPPTCVCLLLRGHLRGP
jgi:hypothetical protein